MSLIQSLIRRLFSHQAAVSASTPVLLKPELMKSVSGGTGGGNDSPFRSW